MDDSYAIASPHNDIFASIYAEFNPNGAPRVPAVEAATFLKTSNLPVSTLGQIWELSDSQKIGSLDKRGAYAAFKLVAAAQQGKPVANSSLYDSSLNPPRLGAAASQLPSASMQHHFQPSFPQQGHPPPVPPPPQISSQSSSPVPRSTWGINPNDQQKYDAIFNSLSPIDGKLSGTSVRPVLMNSGLDAISLAKIWELSDQDKDGQLDRIEMSVALHLVYRALQGDPIPVTLPPTLIHPTKIGYSSASVSRITSRAGSVTSLDEVHTPAYSTIPRQAPRAYSAQAGAPPPPPPPPARPVSGASTPTVPPSSASMSSITAEEWPIKIAEHSQSFAQCDTNHDGLVDGQDVRGMLLQTGIAPQILGQVWALADIKKSGQLNLEQFSLLFYFIESFKSGGQLPMELPTNLIPPSFRERSMGQSNPSVVTPQLPEATSMEIKEALDGDNEEMKELAKAIQELILERKTAEENVIQLEADMTVKNSKIKNLQIELATLESTVKQLERQKLEANRRLNDYDTQISQLAEACEAQKRKKDETEKRMKQIEEDAKNSELSKAKDEEEIDELRNELSQLEASLKTAQQDIKHQVGEKESIVAKLANVERSEARDHVQINQLEKEIEKTKTMTEEIVKAVELEADKMEEALKNKSHILSTVIDKSLLSDDTSYNNPSTSNGSNNNNNNNNGMYDQPPDPFASVKPTQTDPFAQADPFAAQSTWSAEFPTDPFAQGFPADAAFAPGEPVAAKPPPPRPAPPKSARTTPDPFSAQPQTTAPPPQNGANFANFADFGSAFN